MRTLVRRLGLAYRYLKATNPARLRAAWTALLALAAALGLAVPAGLDRGVTAVLGALAILVPLLQGEATRAVVYSPATHRAELELAARTGSALQEPNGP